MFKQILKNLELLLEELRVWWGQRGYMWTSKGRRPWILVLTLHEALWSSLQRDPWAWEKAISRWARREGGNLSELLRVSARYPELVQGCHSCNYRKLLECPTPPPFCSLRQWGFLLPSVSLTHVSNSWLKLQIKQVLPVTLLACAYTCLPCKHLVQWKHRSCFSFNNLISWNQQGLQSRTLWTHFSTHLRKRSPGSRLPAIRSWS